MKDQTISLFIVVFISSVLVALYTSNIVRAETNLDLTVVVDKTFPKQVIFDAAIEVIHRSTVSSRIAAVVTELNYDVNDVVPKDAIIMKFRDEEFQARVSQLQANLLADKAQSREALARQKEAGLETERVRNLYQRKLLARAGLDKANADLSAANARLQATQAQLKAREAQLNEAQVQLSYTQIIAPYSGVVTERLIELGEMASPGQHLMTGVSLEQLRAIIKVPQYLLMVIKSAEKPVLLLTDGRQIKGEKITIIPQADAKSHSFLLRVDLPEGIEQVYPGMFGKIQFVVGDELVRVIPQIAIIQRSEVAGVYVETKEQHVIFRQVLLGRKMTDGQREVLAGLAVGEQVALDPRQAVRRLKLNRARSPL
ncbi:MAG: RND family efflux transporter MFP subunit [Methylophagaceae bacterium]|jgi:RND family efflux transporter MFP subunit